MLFSLLFFQALLEAPGVKAWQVDLQGRTPLALAAEGGHEQLVLLLKVGDLVYPCDLLVRAWWWRSWMKMTMIMVVVVVVVKLPFYFIFICVFSFTSTCVTLPTATPVDLFADGGGGGGGKASILFLFL